jgi:hypothetical protein
MVPYRTGRWFIPVNTLGRTKTPLLFRPWLLQNSPGRLEPMQLSRLTCVNARLLACPACFGLQRPTLGVAPSSATATPWLLQNLPGSAAIASARYSTRVKGLFYRLSRPAWLVEAAPKGVAISSATATVVLIDSTDLLAPRCVQLALDQAEQGHKTKS